MLIVTDGAHAANSKPSGNYQLTTFATISNGHSGTDVTATRPQTPGPFYSPIGRPSVDPEPLIRMLVVGYCLGNCSERRLCEEAHLNLAYRWFCRLWLDGHVPDRSTFSKTGMAASATATCRAGCSSRWCAAAWTRVLWAAKALRWMRA